MTAHMDATFKVVPRTANIYLLFTMHMVYMDMAFPVIYALMTRKTRHLYEKILSYVKDTCLHGIRIDTIMSDNETALRVAAVTVFPETRLRGCWFYYTKALLKKSRALGLQANQETKKLVKMAMVLPLLPEEQILPGIEILERMPNVNEQLRQFFVYVRRQWLPLHISVHQQMHRTNNLVESFHRDLYRLVSRPHPNIWVLTEKLQMMEHGKAIDLERLDAGHVLPRRRRLRYLHFDQRIQRAQELLTDTGDVRRFLIYMSHSVDGLQNLLSTEQVDEEQAPIGDDVVARVPEPNMAVVNVPVETDAGNEIPQEVACVACLSNRRTHVFLDCRLLCLCDGCIRNYRVSAGDFDDVPSTRCPQCRTRITQQPLRIFM